MPESFITRFWRIALNLFPAYRLTNGRITYISADWREIRLKLPFNLLSSNLKGALFGGCIYGAVDPIYAVMLMKLLGPSYLVWDKAATIHFVRPGRSTLYATCRLDEAEVETIKRELERLPSIDRLYTVKLRDTDGIVHAWVEKTIYIARQDAYKEE
jgi:acyl-coenzyme A thioesterase PaaI-like protein